MHSYLKITSEEISALIGLPYLQQVTYLLGIRPYMDNITALVGIKRGISYQSLAETLYVEPHQGIQSGSPSRQQLRRVIKALERAGLVYIQSDDKQLILKCLLANSNYCAQNKADTNPTQQANINPTQRQPIKSSVVEVVHTKPGIPQTTKADIPLNNNYLYFLFEKFWESYPQKKSKPKAEAVFMQLSPDATLFAVIMQGLQAQITHNALMKSSGQWVPAWKYPAKWLAERCWEDEVSMELLEEQRHAKCTKDPKKRSTRDPFCPPVETDEEDAGSGTGNIIQLQQYRESR